MCRYYIINKGFGEACKVAKSEMLYDHERITKLSKKLVDGLKNNIEKIVLNSDVVMGFPGIINISFSFVEG
jgi:cysteine desulfurase